jgi:hypothetical protein
LSGRETYQRELPIAPVEPSDINLSWVETGLRGFVSVATCPPVSSLSITSLQKRVLPGRPVTLVLATRAGSANASGADTDILVALALTALVDATVELEPPEPPRRSLISALAKGMRTWWSPAAPAPPAASARLLPVVYEPSVVHGSVLISVVVPASAPEGSRVVISRVSVSGCDVALGEAPLEVVIGFNHASEPEGPVMAAAEAGDAPALMRLLEGGASTEEKDEVSAYAAKAPARTSAMR